MSPIKNETHHSKTPMVIILIGVSGSGKTTIGKLLAQALHCEFHDGDDFHSGANKEKMNRGIPLSDADRSPWLATLRELITETLAGKKDAVVACSALRESYRDYLWQPGVRFVYLKGDSKLFRQRLENRKEHFFDARLLADQLETFEEPKDILTVEVAKTPDAIVREVQDLLELGKPAETRIG